jgi:DNA-binding GntR family transcriptional regulator
VSAPVKAPAARGPAPALSPIGRETLRLRVYEELRRAIARGRFSPGQSLTVRGLASALGVSTTPVREALQMLAAEGALTAEPNRFFRVPELMREQFVEIREVRAALEGLAAEKAAGQVTADELSRMEDANRRALAAIDAQDTEAYLAANEEFHFALYAAARSPLLDRHIRALWLQAGPSLRILFKDIALVRELTDYHRTALEALRGGDAAGARDAIRSDVLTAGNFIQEHLQPAGLPANAP